MALTKEQIMTIWDGEGETDAKAQTLLNLFNEDTEQQLTQIKLNKQQIKDEKTEEIAKRHAAEEKLKSMDEAMVKLQQQLKDASPENVQKIWEQKMQDSANIYEKRNSELQSTIDAQKSRIEELEVSQRILECSEEFNKAIQGKNIAPDAFEDFKQYVLGENCHKFTLKPTGDGDKKVYATKDGLTIKQVTEQACMSTFGKNCILNNSFGGGAEGGSRQSVNPKDNPFITKNLTAQLQLKLTNPEQYELLKRQAGL